MKRYFIKLYYFLDLTGLLCRMLHQICEMYIYFYVLEISFNYYIIQVSESARSTRDKAAELEAMKAQLAHIKALMEDGTRIRDSMDSTSEFEQDIDVTCEGAADNGITEDVTNISFECRSDSDDVGHGKVRNSVPTLEDIQVIAIIIFFIINV